MIFGIGTDIVQIDRLQKPILRFGDKFAKFILNEHEIEEWLAINNQSIERKSRFMAKRFAAKEATAKAFGTGFRQGLSFKHIGISHDGLGKPILIFSDIAQQLAKKHHIQHTHLSLSDEKDYCSAMVILETAISS